MTELLLSIAPSALDEAEDNVVQLSLTFAALAVALWATVRYLPSLIERAVHQLDIWIVGDLSVLKRPGAIIGTLFLIGWILTGASISFANGLGSDTSGITEALGDFGRDAGGWIASQATKIAIVVAIAVLVTQGAGRVVPGVIRGIVADRSRPDTLPEEMEKRNTTLSSVVIGAIRWATYAVAAVIILGEIGINVTPIIAAAGVLGIAVGFGAQSLIKDIFAGLFILLEDQYRVGDVVNIAGSGGLVEEVNLRRTVLRDLEFVVHVIPNGQIGVVKNLTKEKSRMMIDVGVAYKEDLDKVISVLNSIGDEMQQDPEWGSIITEKIAVLRVNEFADSSINIRVLGQTLPIRQWDVAGEFRRRVKRRFDEEGIEIPFPHTTLYWGVDQPPLKPSADEVEKAE